MLRHLILFPLIQLLLISFAVFFSEHKPVGNTLGQECKVDQGQDTATLSYAGRNWDARNGKFEIGFEGYKERKPAME